MSKRIDLKGKRFGRLLVLSDAGRSKAGLVLWSCRCDCGGETVVVGGSLRYGATESCGCLNKEATVKHGMWKTPEYKVWSEMLQRCKNPGNQNYHHYGGRGITVCVAWEDFAVFVSEMGRRPSSKHTIERRDNDKGYSLGNCYWATQTEQVRNTRISKNNNSGVNGVSRRGRRFRARIRAGYKEIYLGSFGTIEEAAEARKQGEIKYWGKEHA